MPSRLQGRNARRRIPEAPARNGATARTSPMKRPRRIALAPWRSKKLSTRSRRAAVTPTRGPRAMQEPAPEALAEPEAHQVAERGRDPRDQQHRDEVDVALRRHDPAEHDRRLARRDEPDEGSGLEEGEAADERVGPGPERVGQVRERALEVRRLDEPGRHRGERGGREGGGGEQRADRQRAGGRRRTTTARCTGAGSCRHRHAPPRRVSRRAADAGWMVARAGGRRRSRRGPGLRPSARPSAAARRGRRARTGPAARPPRRDRRARRRARGRSPTPKAISTPTMPPLTAPGSGIVFATWPTK